MHSPSRADSLSGLEVLADPVRRQLYEYAVRRHAPVTRAEAAAFTGVTRSLAAYHLDRLVDAGLLTFTYERAHGRGGPGAGRPAKRYVRAPHEVSITMPPRSYAMLAGMLADAVAADEGGSAQQALTESARAEGRRMAGSEGTDVVAPLVAHGYEPVVADNGDIVMNNCPFHRIAQQHPRLVCALNHELVCGCLEGAGDDPDRAELAPRPGRCCVVIHP